MYTPEDFAEDDLVVLQQIIQENSFALLVSETEGHQVGTHLPFTIDPARGERGTLRCHMAKANPAWKSFQGKAEVLVVFSGPHIYVSPTWYRSTPMVPTWNYVAVHAYGVPELIEEPDGLKSLLQDLVEVNEASVGGNWKLEDQPDTYIEGLLRGIVGFEIPIDRIEGKFKMSQNRRPEDVEGVIHNLQARGSDMELEVAAIMAGRSVLPSH